MAAHDTLLVPVEQHKLLLFALSLHSFAMCVACNFVQCKAQCDYFNGNEASLCYCQLMLYALT